jgi:hypothetical protein
VAAKIFFFLLSRNQRNAVDPLTNLSGGGNAVFYIGKSSRPQNTLLTICTAPRSANKINIANHASLVISELNREISNPRAYRKTALHPFYSGGTSHVAVSADKLTNDLTTAIAVLIIVKKIYRCSRVKAYLAAKQEKLIGKNAVKAVPYSQIIIVDQYKPTLIIRISKPHLALASAIKSLGTTQKSLVNKRRHRARNKLGVALVSLVCV